LNFFSFGDSFNSLWEDQNLVVFNLLSTLQESWLFRIASRFQIIDGIAKLCVYMEIYDSIIHVRFDPLPYN